MDKPTRIDSIKQLPDGRWDVKHTGVSTIFTENKNNCWHDTNRQYVIVHHNYCDSPARYIITEDEFDELVDGRTIRAIKLFRERTGFGLRDAKDMIDIVRRSLGFY